MAKMTVDQIIGLLEAYDCVMPTCGKNVWYPQYTAESVDKFKAALAEHIKEIRLSVVEEVEPQLSKCLLRMEKCPMGENKDACVAIEFCKWWQQFKAKLKEAK